MVIFVVQQEKEQVNKYIGVADKGQSDHHTKQRFEVVVVLFHLVPIVSVEGEYRQEFVEAHQQLGLQQRVVLHLLVVVLMNNEIPQEDEH